METSEKFLSNENFDMNRFRHNEEARVDAGAQVFRFVKIIQLNNVALSGSLNSTLNFMVNPDLFCRETIKIGPSVTPKLTEDLTPTSRTRRFKSFEAELSPGKSNLSILSNSKGITNYE